MSGLQNSRWAPKSTDANSKDTKDSKTNNTEYALPLFLLLLSSSKHPSGDTSQFLTSASSCRPSNPLRFQLKSSPPQSPKPLKPFPPSLR